MNCARQQTVSSSAWRGRGALLGARHGRREARRARRRLGHRIGRALICRRRSAVAPDVARCRAAAPAGPSACTATYSILRSRVASSSGNVTVLSKPLSGIVAARSASPASGPASTRQDGHVGGAVPAGEHGGRVARGEHAGAHRGRRQRVPGPGEAEGAVGGGAGREVGVEQQRARPGASSLTLGMAPQPITRLPSGSVCMLPWLSASSGPPGCG